MLGTGQKQGRLGLVLAALVSGAGPAAAETPPTAAFGAPTDDESLLVERDPSPRARTASVPKLVKVVAPKASPQTLVMVPWADVPMTLAAAQAELRWHGDLPSSGIGSWGLHPVRQPERAGVEVLLGGELVGLGVVLEGGAVLTSLSAIGRGMQVAVRFHDGSTEQTVVRRTHRAYDLALLEPLGNKVRVGLPLARNLAEPLSTLGRRASTAAHSRPAATPGNAGIGRTAQLAASSALPVLQPTPVEWLPMVWGADGVPINGALKPHELAELGSAVVNSSGHLAAIVTFGCVGQFKGEVEPAGCQTKRVALTSSTISEFLGMAQFDPTRVWFGVSGESTDTGWARGVLVRSVAAGSPAARAGLRPAGAGMAGDVIVAINDVPVFELDQLRSVLSEQRPGARASLTVLRLGRLVQLQVALSEGGRDLPVSEAPQPWVNF